MWKWVNDQLSFVYLAFISLLIDEAIDILFAEELGIVLEVIEVDTDEIVKAYTEENVSCYVIGSSRSCDQKSLVGVLSR